MDDEQARLLRQLVRNRATAALGTQHSGEPFVSMVPYVLHRDTPDAPHAFLVHVSALSPHTRDMQAHPRVSLMVTAAEDAGIQPQALPRVTVQGDAQSLDKNSSQYAAAKAAYLARFPDAAITFELADFSIFAIRPVSVRFVAGFGKAHGIDAARFDSLLSVS